MSDTPDDADVDELTAPTQAVLDLVDLGVRGVLARRAGDLPEAELAAQKLVDELTAQPYEQLGTLLLAAIRIIATDVLADLDDALERGDSLDDWDRL